MNVFTYINKILKIKLVWLLVIGSWLLVAAVPTYAATGINKQINFQGKLTNSDGTNVADSTYSVVFSLYTVSSAGTNIWTETQNVTTSNGVFQVSLGSVTSLPGSVDFNTDNLYLGIKVGADAEMTPRVKFAAVPYAFNALKVAGLTVTDTTGTFTLANTKTLAVNNSLTFSGTDGTTLTFQGTDTYVGRATTDTLTNKTIGSTGLVFSGATTDIDTAAAEGLILQGRAASSFNTTSGGLTFQAAGTSAISAIQIGAGGVGSTTPDFLGLDVKSDTGDPAGGFEGAMYYNTFDNKFRCYQGAAWTDCIGAGGGGGGYATIQNEGTALTQRTTFNFLGGGVDCVDNSGSSKTDCSVEFTGSDGAGGTSSNSGLETGTGGFGLLQGCSDDQILKWNDVSAVWECASDRATYSNRLSGDYTNATTTFTDVDDNSTGSSDLGFSVGANETWIFQMNAAYSSPAAADGKWLVTAPTGSTCDFNFHDIEGAMSVSNVACGTSSGTIASTGASDTMFVTGAIVTGATPGVVQLQFGQVAVSGTSTVFSGSWVQAFKISGADLAEVYYTKDLLADPGSVVSLDPSLRAGVKRSAKPYDRDVLGIISTKPGLMVGDTEGIGQGKSVFVALSGRVPVKVSTESGAIKPGDYLTSSSTSGVAMKATRPGVIIGQAMTGFEGPEQVGQVIAFIKNGFFQPELEGTPIFAENEIASSSANEYIPRGEDLTLSDLSVNGLATISADLRVKNNTLVEGILTVIDTVTSRDLIINGLATFFGDVVFKGNVSFNGHPIFSKDTAGIAILKKDSDRVEVVFEKEYEQAPVVTAQISENENILDDEVKKIFETDIEYVVTKRTTKGFTILLNKPAVSDITFSWIALISHRLP